ncbi:MAG: hypothetical protein IJS08_14330 [Victivallales bacterium]|nr:hypothetical protein [Victivallales bacterium]
MATIKIRNNPYASYEYLYLAVDDVSVEGIIDITDGPYIFHSVDEDFVVEGKTVTVSMVDPGTGNTLESDNSLVSITGNKDLDWLFDSEPDDSTSSILFELGNQIYIKGAYAGFGVNNASATVLLYSTLAMSDFKGAVLDIEQDSPSFWLDNASLTIGMGDGQHRDYFQAGTDVYRHVQDTAALRLADGTIATLTQSVLTTDYLYQSSTQRFEVTDSRIVLTGCGIGSISANSTVYYRYADGDDDHSGYYAWKEKWGETVYTNTLEVLASQTHYYTFNGDTPADQGAISDCVLPNTFENVASNGGIKLNNSTMTVDVVRNMSTVSGDLGGIVLNNSTLDVANFVENSGTITATNGSTIQVTGTVFNDNASITVENSTFTASAVSVGSGSTFSVAGESTLDIGELSGTITVAAGTSDDAPTTLKSSSITGGKVDATAGGVKFTGANTLNDINLDATGKTVMVGNADSLTVMGTSTLNIGTLDGTIELGSTTLKNSNLSGGSIAISGTILVNNSTIGSNTFTFASSTDGVIFSGANTLNGVTLDAAINSVTNNGTLTVKGESTLKIGLLSGSGTFKLDGATIKDSSIIFGNGTMLVDAGKSATFSATGTNTNSLANISISNSGTITVNGTMTSDAVDNFDTINVTNSVFTASHVTNSGTLNIVLQEGDESRIITNNFYNTNVGKITIGGSCGDGVTSVISANAGAVMFSDITLTVTSTSGKAVTASVHGGNVAIASGVDYTKIYLSNSIDEDADFGKVVKDSSDDSYYVDFNAFRFPTSALEDGVKNTTTTILLDGTDAAALKYESETEASIDGLAFVKDGVNAASLPGDEQNVEFVLTGMNPADPDSYRELKKGITVGEGVTLTVDKLYQSATDAITSIDGILKAGTYNTGLPDDPATSGVDESIGTNTFQVAAGQVNINGGGALYGCMVLSGGATTVYDGGYAENIAMENGGRLDVFEGGSATGITASEGAALGLTVAPDTYVKGTYAGSAFELKDASITGFTVHSNCWVGTSNGGVASNTTVLDGGQLFTLDGGVVSSTTVNSGGAVDVFSRGVADAVTINGGGALFVDNGGVVNDVTVNSGGVAEASNGVISGATVNAGGSLMIYSGTKITGQMTFESGAEVIPFVGLILDFDLTQTTAGADPLVNDLSVLLGTPTYTVTTSSQQAIGTYVLAGGAENFTGTLTVKREGAPADVSITVGNTNVDDDVTYTLTIANNQLLFTITTGNITPPVAPTASADVTTPTNGNVTVTVVFSDDTTTKQYSLDGEAWSTYAEPIVFSDNGMVYFRGMDAVGNVSAVTSYEVTNIDKVAPATPEFTQVGDAATGELVVTATWDATDAQCLYSLDGQTWQQYTAPLRFSQDAQVQFKTVDAAGNASEIADCKVKLTVTPDDITVGSTAFGQTVISWPSDDLSAWSNGYDVRLTVDGVGCLTLNNISGQGVELCNSPADSANVMVKPQETSKWPTNGEKTVELDPVAGDGPQLVEGESNGFTDAMFGRVTGVWNASYCARHTGLPGERAKLNGMNQIGDLFFGSDDSSLLLLTDDANGDAFFLDDIYSAFPEGVDAQARLANINVIQAGAGADVVDLTSTRFEYVGGGLTVHGGLGNDVIWANSGDNLLFGDGGNDRIVGATGNDVIVGGVGNDRMHGGGGDDVFTFCDNWGADEVEQLAGGKVTLWFASGDESKWNPDTLTYSDGDNSVTVKGGTSVELKFGNDGSTQCGMLSSIGAFTDFSTQKIFEESDGLLAAH